MQLFQSQRLFGICLKVYPENLATTLRARIEAEHGLLLWGLVLLKPRTCPKEAFLEMKEATGNSVQVKVEWVNSCAKTPNWRPSVPWGVYFPACRMVHWGFPTACPRWAMGRTKAYPIYFGSPGNGLLLLNSIILCTMTHDQSTYWDRMDRGTTDPA